ncbi:MAG: RdgB/HAM1 family non-canonical purine NTP pyrophosphatase [Pleomorphochaeta sp.]
MEFILATTNDHKYYELKDLMPNIEIIKATNMVEVDENEPTFLGNALIKAKALYDILQKPVIADDSGLCVEALNNEPGVKTARYGSDVFNRILESSERNEYLLSNLKNETNRNASFVCTLVAYISPNRIYTVTEEVKGIITEKQFGKDGFGYDPVFFLPELNKTMAEIDGETKGLYSHRGRAARAMNKILENIE